MSTQNRRSSLPSSAKRHATENPGKVAPLCPHLPKKRPALANVTNQRQQPSSQNAPPNNSILVPCSTKTASAKKGPPTCSNNAGFGGSILVPCSTKTSNVKKGPSTGINNTGFGVKKGPSSTFVKPTSVNSSKSTSFPRNNVVVPRIAPPPPASSRMDISPPSFNDLSVSMDETMSTCDSFNSPDVEYIDNNDMAAIDSIERKTSSKLFISDHAETAGTICKREILADMESDIIVDVDSDLMDPQLCATMACDIYKHLRASEAKKRPSIYFMESVQKDINPSMRAILIDWLVEVAEEYRLVHDTLYLTINYIDRYLSGNLMDRQRLQLLGVACMMIAAKYEEICAPQVEEFCYITDNTYLKEEVLQMESTVLNFLKFEMTAPTARCFLRRFCRAAQGINEAPSLQLEYLANYVAELSLLEYNMLCYAPSLIAASAIFLAQYILSPSTRPWNSTLRHYTLYQPSDLRECVKALHSLCSECQSSSLPAIREKYSQHKYKFVAKKYCPPSIPSEYFENLCN